jgi:WD40 repeat protein
MEITKVIELSGHKAGIYAMHKGEEDHLIYASGGDNHLIEWNLYEPDKSKAIANLPSNGYCIVKLIAQNVLLIGSFNGGIHVIDLALKKEIRLLKAHESIVFDLIVIPHNNEFIAVSGDGTFSVWSSLDFTLIKQIKLTDKRLRSIDYSKNKNILAIGCSDGTTRILNADTYKELIAINGGEDERFINKVVFHPKADALITGSRGFLCIWNTNTFELIERIAAHQFSVYGIAFNPDGTLFASSSMDKTIRIWNANTYKLEKEISRQNLKGHTNSINALLWTTYNDYLVSGGDDKKVMAWKVFDYTC